MQITRWWDPWGACWRLTTTVDSFILTAACLGGDDELTYGKHLVYSKHSIKGHYYLELKTQHPVADSMSSSFLDIP